MLEIYLDFHVFVITSLTKIWKFNFTIKQRLEISFIHSPDGLFSELLKLIFISSGVLENKIYIKVYFFLFL